MVFMGIGTFGQSGPCDNTVPVYIVNLEGNANGVWSMPGIIRDGSCCSYSSPPISCVKFIVTLDENAEGIIFNVTDGALPQNLTWQLMNGSGDYCDTTQYPANVPVCLNGAGPHTIIFCKPGGNNNTYSITSVPAPGASGDVIVNDGCTDYLNAYGFDPATIQWNSIYPGSYGQFNSYLSCQNCESVSVTGQTGMPAYIDFQICGLPLGSCNPQLVCDTVRATFNTTLFVNILPEQPTVCYGGTNTTIYAQGIGGSPPYTYTWSNGQTGSVNNVGVGTYIVTVSDISGCPPNYDTVVVTAFNSEIQAIAGNDKDVCSDNITVNLAGGVIAATGGYWAGGTGIFSPNNTDLFASYTPSNAEVFAGIATLQLITTGNGSCPADTDALNIYIHKFNAQIDSYTNISCNSGNNGTASVIVTTGTEPYTYLWSNSTTGSTATNLTAGQVSVTVSDYWGCSNSLYLTLTEPTPITATYSTTSSNCGGNNGSATIIPSGGTPPYNYLWQTGATTQTIINVTHGIYLVTVTDSHSCAEVFSIYIDDESPPYIDITSSQDVLCNGDNTGSATVEITTPGIGTHTYLWNSSPPQTTATATNLPAGTYTVVVTDEIGCTGSDVVTITQPEPINISFITGTINCYGQTNAFINTTVTGGTYPYSYGWSTGSTNNFINNIPAGNYILTVTDANTCTAIDSTNITQPPKLNLSNYSVTNVKCNGNSTGSLLISVQGGIYPYSYSWSNGSSSTFVSNLPAGNYSVTVTDANGCTIDTIFTITQPTPLNITFNTTNVSCYQGNNGTITSNVTGGVSPYLYFWSNGASTGSISNITAGTYNLMIRDNNNCSYINTVSITEPTPLYLTINRKNVSCFGDSDGIASISASGGTPNYTYEWSTGATSFNISNLLPGNYYVTVTDSKLCTIDTVIEILEPQQLQILVQQNNVSCHGYNDGAIDITIDGGIYPYNYLWSTAATTEDISSLAPGGYSVQVTDFNGCNVYGSIVISEPYTLSVTSSAIETKCFDSSDGAVNITVTGGTTPYSYIWTNGTVTEDLNGIIAGNYSVTVTDINNCIAIHSAIVDRPDSISLTFTSDSLTCFESGDGKATVFVTGGIPPYSYLWDTSAASQTSYTAYNLDEGTYSVSVTDNNQCIATSMVPVFQPVQLLVLTSTDDTICPGFSATITANASGGNVYTYYWSNGLGAGQTQIVSPVQTTSYYVSVKDEDNCYSNKDSVKVIVRNIYPDSLFVSKAGDVCEGKSTTIFGNYTDIYGGFTLEWSNELGTGTGPFTVTPDTTTTYYLTVTNICNNSAFKPVTVNVFKNPDISLDGLFAEGCEPFEVTLRDTTLPLTYSYLWNFGDGNTSMEAAPTYIYPNNGTYYISLEVTSTEGCFSEGKNISFVRVFDNPKPVIDYSPPIADIRKPEFVFHVESPVIMDVFWEFGDGDTSILSSPTHLYSDTGIYIVSAYTTNEHQCKNKNDVIVIVNPYYGISIPNAFTPNPNASNGGIYYLYEMNNDVFYPIVQFVKTFKMSIFNRWGELIFESTDVTIGWDGYYRGELCKQDVYVWKIEIEYTNGQTDRLTGHVTLLR